MSVSTAPGRSPLAAVHPSASRYSVSGGLPLPAGATDLAFQHRSLSAFSRSEGNQQTNAISPLHCQRSLSSQGLPSLGRAQTTTNPAAHSDTQEIRSGMTGSNSIFHANSERHPSSIPSSSSDSTFPRTPSDLSISAVKLGQKVVDQPHVEYLATLNPFRQHKAAISDVGVNRKPAGPRSWSSSVSSVSTRHTKTASVPLAEGQSVHERMKERHRLEARDAGLSPDQTQSVSMSHNNQVYPPRISPQASLGLPCPAGVDPALYASRKSITNHQKTRLILVCAFYAQSLLIRNWSSSSARSSSLR